MQHDHFTRVLNERESFDERNFQKINHKLM